MNKQTISVVIGAVVGLLVSGISFAQGNEGPVFVPVETFTCTYNEGKGPSDLDAAVAAFNEYLDQIGNDTYAAWTLEKHYYGPDQDFDVLWMGAWKNANEMGAGVDNYLANGGAVQAGFDSVLTCNSHANFVSLNPVPPPAGRTPESGAISFSDCTLEEGAKPSDVTAAMAKWGEALKEAGIETGIYHWYPIFGGGDADFDFKWVQAHANHTALGKLYETMGNGGLYLKERELFSGLLDCDVARVYNAKNRRRAQLR